MVHTPFTNHQFIEVEASRALSIDALESEELLLEQSHTSNRALFLLLDSIY